MPTIPLGCSVRTLAVVSLGALAASNRRVPGGKPLEAPVHIIAQFVLPVDVFCNTLQVPKTEELLITAVGKLLPTT
jgi:hypothetical protein